MLTPLSRSRTAEHPRGMSPLSDRGCGNSARGPGAADTAASGLGGCPELEPRTTGTLRIGASCETNANVTGQLTQRHLLGDNDNARKIHKESLLILGQFYLPLEPSGMVIKHHLCSTCYFSQQITSEKNTAKFLPRHVRIRNPVTVHFVGQPTGVTRTPGCTPHDADAALTPAPRCCRHLELCDSAQHLAGCPEGPP